MGPEQGAKLLDALRANTNVTSVNLSFNELTQLGAASVADLLRSNSTIREIGLRCNSFGNEGATALADALRSNTTLQLFRLDQQQYYC